MKKYLVAICLVLGLALTACGGDDGDDNSGPQLPPVSETSAPSNDGNAAPDLSDVFDDEDCQATAEALAAAAGGAAAAGLPDAQQALNQLKALAEDAPIALKRDFAIFARALENFFRALQDADIDFNDPSTLSNPANAAALSQAATAFTNEAQGAATNIQRQLAEVCDFDAS